MLFRSAIALAISTGTVALAQERISEEVQAELEQVQKTVDSFFRNFTDKSIGPDKSLRELLIGSPLKDRKEAIATLTQQAGQLEKQYGAYLNHERVAYKMHGSDLMLVRYLFKCEKFPVIWNFYFYRPGNSGLTKRDWTLIELKFDANLESLDR